jgi:hypothetical protein
LPTDPPLIAIIVLLVLVPIFIGWGLASLRDKRKQARFFDPAIDHAERVLQRLAERAHGRYTASPERWSALSPPIGFRLKTVRTGTGSNSGTSKFKAMPGSGYTQLERAGFIVKVGWLVVGLEEGFALLPRIRVVLPPGFTFSGLHDASGHSLSNPWDLWFKGVYGRRDHGSALPLTPPEKEAFEALSARSCRIHMQSATPATWLGTLPDPYALEIDAWVVAPPLSISAAPTEPKGIHSWRHGFDLASLDQLMDLAVALARTATPKQS